MGAARTQLPTSSGELLALTLFICYTGIIVINCIENSLSYKKELCMRMQLKATMKRGPSCICIQ